MKLFIKSIIIGFASIMPGISGSVIAISFGVYEQLLNIIKSNSYKSNIKYLLILSTGVSLGIFLTANIIFKILKYKIILNYVLLGYLIYHLPLFYRKIKKIRFLIIFLSFFITYLFSLISSISFDSIKIKEDIIYVIGGFLFSLGKIFPGLSSTFFLLILGIYDKIIKIFVNPIILFKEMAIYKYFLFGSIVGLFLCAGILKKICNNNIDLLYNVILGIFFETILCMFPGFKFETEYMIGFILMVIFYILLKIRDNKI